MKLEYIGEMDSYTMYKDNLILSFDDMVWMKDTLYLLLDGVGVVLFMKGSEELQDFVRELRKIRGKGYKYLQKERVI